MARRALFHYFRTAWGPRASYHLMRVRLGDDWRERLASVAWLVSHRVPLNGAAPSMQFRGVSHHV